MRRSPPFKKARSSARKSRQNNVGGQVDPMERDWKAASTSTLVSKQLLGRASWVPQTTRPIDALMYYENDLKVGGTAGVKTDYFFFANGLYDPNATGTGHQVLHFDQLMLEYEHYVVTKAKCRVDFVNETAKAAVVGIFISPDAVSSTDVSKAIENGQIVTKLVDSTTRGGPSYATVELDLDVRKNFGRRSDREMLEDVDLSGGATTSPAEGVYFGVTSWGFPQGTNMDIYFNVTISYTAIFYEPRKISSSLEQKCPRRR